MGGTQFLLQEEILRLEWQSVAMAVMVVMVDLFPWVKEDLVRRITHHF